MECGKFGWDVRNLYGNEEISGDESENARNQSGNEENAENGSRNARNERNLMSQERNAGNAVNRVRNERNWRENVGVAAEMRRLKITRNQQNIKLR